MSTLKIIGRYIVKLEIARGGMATVYHAYDPRFERDVAVKVLPQAFLHDPQFRLRFDREAKMIALLEHPAIVPVYDFGEEAGQPYIVMRYMSGGSLNERIRQGAFSLAETSQLVSRISSALDAAHSRNIIHRDLKPGNILFDQYGNAYLSDFGIARISEERGATLTGTAILGTPTYMSPEQIQGDKEIDGRSDIYALGVLVYQMLSGQAPYQADTPAKVMMMHVLQPVPNIRDSRVDLPSGSEALIARAMAKNPDDRFTTSGEFAAELEKLAQRGKMVAPEEAHTMISGPRGATEAATRVAAGGTVVPSAGTVVAPGKTSISVPAGEAAAPPAVGEVPAKKKRSPLAVAIPVVIIVVLLLAGAVGLGIAGSQGSGPLAFLAAPTATQTQAPDTPTPLPPTETSSVGGNVPAQTPTITSTQAAEAPTETPALETPTEAATPTSSLTVIGGADKIGWIDNNDIWVANLDGSEITQLTTDGTDKTNPHWTPDGEWITYISGKCVQAVKLADGEVKTMLCLNFVEYLKEFNIAPDNERVAVGVDNQLYIIPNDERLLADIKSRADLTRIADCEHFAPYLRNYVKTAIWNRDGSQLGMVIFGVARGIGSADVVQIISMEKCTPEPVIIDNFPPPRFRPPEYDVAPQIQNFGWDGLFIFALATYVRNDGFGNLYIYNSDLKKATDILNPIDGSCCYRDPDFSPDGSHLIFAYQKYPSGDNAISFYMIPFGTIGTGVTYEPLPIPPLVGNAKAKPELILRPAK
jgi:hypothetical protein